MVGGFLGAKLWWFAEELARNPNAGLATLLSVEGLRGGLTWYGGFFGGAIGGILAARSYGLPLLDTAERRGAGARGEPRDRPDRLLPRR